MSQLIESSSRRGVAGCRDDGRVLPAGSPAAWQLVDRLFILAVLLWGNWAVYYWIAVLGFDASFRSLRSGLPILLAQFLLSAWLVRRWELPVAGRDRAPRPGAAPPADGVKAGRRALWVAGAVGVLAGLVGLVWTLKLSRSPVGYNLLWAAIMPLFLAAYAARPRGLGGDAAAAAESDGAVTWAGLDLAILAAVCAAGLWAATCFGFPGPDDAFYAHVMSSTLAHPDLPVQGQDLLLGTSAPYTIHPGYRASGFEVLAALIADLARCDPLWVYYDLYPQAGVLFWVLAAHVFLRSLGLPLPALGVGASMALLLFWMAEKSPGVWFWNLHLGKGCLASIGAPLIFGTVAAFARRREPATWLVAFLSFCAVLGWTSSAMFIAPVSLALATAVYLPWSWRSANAWAAIGIMLAPAAGLIAATSRVVARVPPALADATGEILVQGESLGGIRTQAMLFLTLLALPLAARAVRGWAGGWDLPRLALVGGLTVFAPYWIEALAVLGGVSLLSWRMPWAFPSSLVVGVLVCLLVAVPLACRSAPAGRRTLLWSVPVLCGWIVVWLHSFSPLFPLRDAFAVRVQRRCYVEALMQDAREIRALLPTEGLVASGYLNEFLPILPRPPRFAAVRFYLPYHRAALSEDEFRHRMALDRVLVQLKPDSGRDVDETAAEAVRNIRRLGITGVVFATTPAAAAAARWRYGRHREPTGSVELIEALTRGLAEAGFECHEISSGKARVCRLPVAARPQPGSTGPPPPSRRQ